MLGSNIMRSNDLKARFAPVPNDELLGQGVGIEMSSSNLPHTHIHPIVFDELHA